MYWLYGIGCLVILAGFLLYAYYFGDRPRVLKPKKLKEDKDPIYLKDVLWTGKPEREYYEKTGQDPKTEKDFYKQIETNEIYVIETKCDSLVGCFGPISINQMDEHLLHVVHAYPCQPNRNDWLKANGDKLVVVALRDRGGLK